MANCDHEDKYYFLERSLEWSLYKHLMQHLMQENRIYCICCLKCEFYPGCQFCPRCKFCNEQESELLRQLVADLGKFKIEVRSREDERHVPHMHVKAGKFKAVCSFKGERLAGWLPQKIEKEVIKWIRGPEVKKAVDVWNKFHPDRPV